MDFTGNNVSPFDLTVGQPQAQIPAVLLSLLFGEWVKFYGIGFPKLFSACISHDRLFFAPVNIYSEVLID